MQRHLHTLSPTELNRLSIELKLYILSFLPSSYIAVVARVVCKDAYKKFRHQNQIVASCDDLPPGVHPSCLLDFIQHYQHMPQRQHQLMEAIAKQGDLPRLKFLRQHGCAWDESVCEAAAARGHLNVLGWIRAQNPPCDWGIVELLSQTYQRPSVCARAACNGHLAVLQWLRAQDPPCGWDLHVCFYAAWRGHLDILQWAIAQDPPAPWDGRACLVAAMFGRLDVLKLVAAHEPLLSWDKAECLKVAKHYDRIAVVKWIQSLG